MTEPTQTAKQPKIAFIFDDRLSHDRKVLFARTMSIIKSHFSIEILSAQMTEDALLEHLQANEYALVLIPWYKYIGWKNIENFFGSMRLSGPTVAGYFADLVLPFEFSGAPHYHRFIFLDFYRMESAETEMQIRSLLYPAERSGFRGNYFKNTLIYCADWFENDGLSTQCLDTMLKLPVLQHNTWAHRLPTLRFFMTALWSLCFQEKRSYAMGPCAQLEVTEVNKHLAIKLVFESKSLTLKNLMDYLWPNGNKQNPAMNELVRYADFLRVHVYPENHKLEITAFFTPHAPSIEHPGEVRGFWIEPLKAKFMIPREAETVGKRIPIQTTRSEKVAENLQKASDLIQVSLLQLTDPNLKTPAQVDGLVAHIQVLSREIEKLAEKKKIA